MRICRQDKRQDEKEQASGEREIHDILGKYSIIFSDFRAITLLGNCWTSLKYVQYSLFCL